VGLPGAAATGPYADSKQDLRALADRLRDRAQPGRDRVLSVYPGRTATSMQAAIHRQEGKSYRPERLPQPEDVATVVLQALAMPAGAEVTDVAIRPMRKP
jgi:NADP-dependent 3-hydroxy acid dehydrogenase YdfG